MDKCIKVKYNVVEYPQVLYTPKSDKTSFVEEAHFSTVC